MLKILWVILLLLKDSNASGLNLLAAFGLPLDSLPTENSNVSRTCQLQAKFVREEADKMQMWALQMIDASAKQPAGVLSGNLNQFGDFDLCISAIPSKPDLSARYCLVDVDVVLKESYLQDFDDRIHAYRFMTSNITDISQRLPKIGQWRWGLCVPSGCTPQDITAHLKHELLTKLPSGTSLQVQTDPILCYENQQGQSYSLGFYLTVTLLVFIAFCLAWGTFVELFGKQSSPIQRYLQCFSLNRNFRELISVERESEDVPVLHGARTVFAISLLLSHKKMAQLFYPFSNAVFVSQKMDSEWTMLGRAAILYTDAFILMSGFLTAFSMVRTLDRQHKIQLVHTLLTRYLRFLPNLFFIILCCTFLTEMMGPGPLWGIVVTKYSLLCKANMWRNFLFIHNYFGFDDMCLTHTHQLGIDMQLFMASPFLVYLLWRRPRLGVATLTLIALASTYLRYTVALTEQLSPIIHYGVSVNRLFRTANYSYILPTHRASVYVLGLLFGYAARRGVQQMGISVAAGRFGWSLAVLAGLLPVFGPAHMGRRGYVYSAYEAAIYNAFAPLLWSGSLMWVAVAGWNNRGGPIYSALTWKYLAVFSRISYAFYLVQFPVFFYNVGTLKTTQYYNGILSMIDLKEFGVVVLLSIVLTLAVDLPFQNIRKLLLPSRTILLKEKVENNNESVKGIIKTKSHG